MTEDPERTDLGRKRNIKDGEDESIGVCLGSWVRRGSRRKRITTSSGKQTEPQTFLNSLWGVHVYDFQGERPHARATGCLPTAGLRGLLPSGGF